MRVAVVRMASLAVAAMTALAACSEPPTKPGVDRVANQGSSSPLAGSTLQDWLGGLLGPASPAPGGSVLVGAGDIAECYHGSTPPLFVDPSDARNTAAGETAELLEQIPGTIMAVGDNAYQYGSPFDYEACYTPTWGRGRPSGGLYARTQPAAGNHEYMTPGAAGFFAYFPDRSGLPRPGYYSYNLGSWHVIVLNSTPQVYACYPPELGELESQVAQQPWWQELWGDPQLPREPTSIGLGRACPGDAAQQAWLVSDLMAHADYACTAVYFHHPRFSSGTHGNHYQMQRVWDILYLYGVDVVVAAHDHNYERFAPQDQRGRYDPVHGIRQFVVGTGGADLRSVGPPLPNSEVLFTGVHGVLGLALNQGSYGWAFVAVDRSVRDSGSESCHAAPRRRAHLPFRLPAE